MVSKNKARKVHESRSFFKTSNPPYLTVQIPVPFELWPALQEQQAAIERVSPGHKFYHPRYYHVTAKLIGWDKHLPRKALLERIAEVAAETRPFKLELRGVGVFPTCVFAQVFDSGGNLRKLHNSLCRALSGLVSVEPVEGENFLPHVALLSFDNRTGPELTRLLRRSRHTSFGSFTADRLQFAEAKPYLNVGCFTVVREFRFSENGLTARPGGD